jgi:hypothetical protein
MENLTAADIAAVTRPNFMGMGYGGYGGFGMGGWEGLIALIVLAGLFGNGGFGGFGGGAGAGWQQGFNTQNILSKLDGITNGLCDGFYSVATNSLQAQNQLQRDLCTGFAAVNAGISENRFAAQQCCCETQRAIDGVNFNNSKNTCDIINAIHAEGEATRAQMTQNTIQALRDKLNDKDRDIQTRDFQLSQLAQNSYLVNTLNPAPIPAYTVQNPKCCYNPCGCACGAYAD